MAEILLVEDDPVLGRGLSVNLSLEKFQVEWVSDLSSALKQLQTRSFDLVLLDLGLPDGSGFDLLKTVREKDLQTPIVILTAKTDEDSVVQGLQLGANDYVKKPFGDRELLARIRTAMRQQSTQSQDELSFEKLVLLKNVRRVFYDEVPLDVTPKEFETLAYFLKNAEAVITREALLGVIDKDGNLFDRTVDSHISHIRTRLRKAGVKNIQISSVYGVGYRLEKL